VTGPIESPIQPESVDSSPLQNEPANEEINGIE
jgi:hypothetical protein